MSNLTNKQWLGIAMVCVGVIAAGSAQLTEILGPQATKAVVALAGLLNSALGGILVVVTGQASIVQEVRAMPGVEHITVNAKANQTLAKLALDPTEDKIAPERGAMEAITATAKGTV